MGLDPNPPPLLAMPRCHCELHCIVRCSVWCSVSLLQKRPIILRSLQIVATPYGQCAKWMSLFYTTFRSPTILHRGQNSNPSSRKQHLMIRMRHVPHTISNSQWHRGIASRHSLRARHFQSIENLITCDIWIKNTVSFIRLFCKRDL